MPDMKLTLKAAMLLALTSASRASERQALDIACLTDADEEDITFALPTLTKSRKIEQKPLVITLHGYPANPTLDVVTCVRDYISRTRSWRTTPAHRQLLLGIALPHKPVVTSTISNWLKTLMEWAGVDVTTYKAHYSGGMHVKSECCRSLSCRYITCKLEAR